MRTKFVLAVTILVTATSLSVLWPAQHAQTLTVRLIAGPPGATLEERDRIVVALPIKNQGSATAENVQITSIKLRGGELLDPKLPSSLRTIRPRESATVFATFGKGEFRSGQQYQMTVEGTFGRGTRFVVERPVKLPPASPGSANARPSYSKPHRVRGAPYPPRRPAFPREINEGTIWTVPTGRYREPQRSEKETSAEKGPQPQQHHSVLKPPASVAFFVNAPAGINGSSTNEPSGAVGGEVVFVSANWSAAYSTNNGGSFTQLTPSTIFPNADGGFCCDQIVHYVPSIDRFVWLMQYSRAAAGNNRYRLAAASPTDIRNSNGTAWTYWDITSTQLGFGTNWIDYPDMSVGDNSLYLSFDEVGFGLTVVRIPLAEIRDRVTINFWYTDPNNSPMAYGGHLTQNTQDEIFWAGHNSNSSMRVFSWQESSTTYFWRDIGIGSWPNDNAAGLMSTSPDGQDWLTKLRDFPVNAVLGSTRVRDTSRRQVDQVWFAWSAPAGNNFRQPHVQWVALNRSNNFSLVTQQQIWNSSYAFSYPALAVNSNNEVGLSLEYGGGGNYQNHVVGFWGDFIVYITTATNTGLTRYGDYVSIRRDAARPERFNAFGYARISSGGSTRSDTRYVSFGR